MLPSLKCVGVTVGIVCVFAEEGSSLSPLLIGYFARRDAGVFGNSGSMELNESCSKIPAVLALTKSSFVLILIILSLLN